MSEKGKYDVFVSYSSKNKNVADAIVADFEQHGIRCWYAPRDIMPGTSWVSAITDALRMVKVQVLIYTDESNTSRQVMNEVALAFNEGKTIVPFRLSETRMSDEFEYYLSRVHWLDAVTKNLSDNITKLRNYVEVILSGVEKAYTSNARESKKKLPTAYKIIAICAAVLILSLVSVTAYLIFSDNDGGEIRTLQTNAYNDVDSSALTTDNNENADVKNAGVTDANDMIVEEKENKTTADAVSGENSGKDTADAVSGENSGKTTAGAVPGENFGKDTADAVPGENSGKTTAGAVPGENFGKTTAGAVPGDGADDSTPKDNAKEKDVHDMTVEELEAAAKSGDPVACELLGDIYYYGKNVDESDEEAGRYYKKAIDMGSTNSKVFANYGMVLYRDDRFGESAVFFERSAELDPDPTTMYNAGLAYFGAEDFENAVKWLEKAIDSGFARPQDAKKLIEQGAGHGTDSDR